MIKAYDLDGVIAEVGDVNYNGRTLEEIHKHLLSLPVKFKPTGNFHIITARVEADREVTKKWLSDNGIRYQQLIMVGEIDFKNKFILNEEDIIRKKSEAIRVLRIVEYTDDNRRIASGIQMFSPDCTVYTFNKTGDLQPIREPMVIHDKDGLVIKLYHEWKTEFVDIINKFHFLLWGEAFQDYLLWELRMNLVSMECYIFEEDGEVVSILPLIPRINENKKLYFFEDFSFPMSMIGKQFDLSLIGLKEIKYRTDIAVASTNPEGLWDKLMKKSRLKRAWKQFNRDDDIQFVTSEFNSRKLSYVLYEWSKYCNNNLNDKSIDSTDLIKWDNHYELINVFKSLGEKLVVIEGYYKKQLLSIGYYYRKTPNELYWIRTQRIPNKEVPMGTISNLYATHVVKPSILNLGVDYIGATNKKEVFGGIQWGFISCLMEE